MDKNNNNNKHSTLQSTTKVTQFTFNNQLPFDKLNKQQNYVILNIYSTTTTTKSKQLKKI